MNQLNINNIEKTIKRFNYIKLKIETYSDKKNDEMIKLYKEYSSIKKISELYIAYKKTIEKLEETKNLSKNSEKDIQILAEEEIIFLDEKKTKYENEIKKLNIVNIYKVNFIYLIIILISN